MHVRGLCSCAKPTVIYSCSFDGRGNHFANIIMVIIEVIVVVVVVVVVVFVVVFVVAVMATIPLYTKKCNLSFLIIH